MTEIIAWSGHVGISASARVEGDRLFVPIEELAAATGWELKPEGLCRGEECVPIPPAERDYWLRDGALDLTAFAQHRGDAVAHDPDHHVWAFVDAPPGGPRTVEAPAFTLPDLAGRPHSLSDYRGRRVFLVSWASW